MAGAIWHGLNTHGEVSIAQLKKLVEGKAPLFDWAIGWLAREDKIVITLSSERVRNTILKNDFKQDFTQRKRSCIEAAAVTRHWQSWP